MPKPLPVDSRDPLARVLALGSRRVRTGLVIGFAGGLSVHIAAAGHGQAVSQLVELRTFAAMVRADIRSRVHTTFDIEKDEPPPEPEPEPPPPEPEEPEPKPEPKQLPPDEPVPPPPAAAEAAKVVAMEADPNAPLDLTGFTIVTGNAERSPGGLTASSGTSKRPVFDRAAKATGVGDAKPTVVAPPKPAVDLSRPPQVAGGTGWSCPWPAEADIEQTNFWQVPLLVAVAPDGRPQNVTVLGNEGSGFGAKARACALRQRYAPALDAGGKAVAGTIRLNMKFTR